MVKGLKNQQERASTVNISKMSNYNWLNQIEHEDPRVQMDT